NTWGTDLPDLPQQRSHPAGMRRSDGILIVTGGLGGLYASMQMADTWSLTPLAPMWDTKAPLPNARGGCAYGVVQGRLICAGGEAGMSALGYTESYDPITDVWNTEAMMPERRAGTQGAAIGQALYV